MQIIFLGEGKFRIKSKSNTITTGQEIKINDYIINSPGEYEVGGIEVEVVDGISLLHLEDLDIAYLGRRKKPLSDKEVEAINETDVLFIPVGGGEVFSPKEALGAINQIEPKTVIPMYYGDISEFSHLEGVEIENLNQLKITKSEIDEENRKVIVLNVDNQ